MICFIFKSFRLIFSFHFLISSVSFLISLVLIFFGKSHSIDSSFCFSSGFKGFKTSSGLKAFKASTCFIPWSLIVFLYFSKVISSSLKRQLVPQTLPNLLIENIRIKRGHVAKFLGVFINKNLSWKQHIDIVSSKHSQ